MISKLIDRITDTGAPIVVGLDPKLAFIPDAIKNKCFEEKGENPEGAAEAFWQFNKVTHFAYLFYDRVAPELRREIAESVLLCNATGVGFGSQLGQCLIPDTSYLRPDLLVTDVIYSPAETPLLKMANEVGCRTCNGLDMMLYQGAASFRIWTGREMPVELVRKAL